MKGSALVMEFSDRAALDDYLANEPLCHFNIRKNILTEDKIEGV